MPSPEQLLSILCDALDELEGVNEALDEMPFERPAPPSLLHRKIMAEQRVNDARKACEWTNNSFRAKRYDID